MPSCYPYQLKQLGLKANYETFWPSEALSSKTLKLGNISHMRMCVCVLGGGGGAREKCGKLIKPTTLYVTSEHTFYPGLEQCSLTCMFRKNIG